MEEETSPLFSNTPSANGEEIKAKINVFRERMSLAAAGEVSNRNGNLTPEEVNWNLEANLNATYAMADFSFSEMHKDDQH